MNYSFRVRCICGAEFQAGDSSGVTSERNVREWERAHRDYCIKAIKNTAKESK